MGLWRRTNVRRCIQTRPTAGDFPHARRRGVRVACCTCTCCCFTFLLGGVGGVAGLVMGLVHTVRAPITVENPIAVLAIGFLRLLIYLAGYGIAGALIGAAIGFGIDVTMGFW